MVHQKGKVIVLGSSGFIGSYILKRFQQEKYPAEGYSSRECDLLLEDSLNENLSVTPDDVIIMFSSITRLIANSFDSMVKNIKMADNLSEFIAKNPVKHVIFLSTVDVYGLLHNDEILQESNLANPNDYYAISKLVSESILRNCCSAKKIPLLILRLTGIYGPGNKNKSTVYKLVESALNKKVTIFGDGSNKRDFVYVDDIYKIITLAMEQNTNEILNVATGKSYTIKQIVDMLGDVIQNKFDVMYQQDTATEARAANMVYDVSLLKKTFPNLQLTDLHEGLKRYLERSCE